MRSILIIGTGHFGRHLCEKLWELGNEVMIVDKNEEGMSSLLPMVTAAQVGDCTRREVVKTLGVGNFDMCFVCIGSDFESSSVSDRSIVHSAVGSAVHRIQSQRRSPLDQNRRRIFFPRSFCNADTLSFLGMASSTER